MLKEVKTLPAIYPRKRDAHKGDFGRVAVVAGSLGMTGAACLAARAALRAGAGLVTLAVPESLLPIVASQMTCVMTRPFTETVAKTFALAALDELLEFCGGMDAVAVGPGMGRESETQILIRSLYEKLECPVIFDADGLNALAGDADMLRRTPDERPTVLTPHPGELSRLMGVSAADIQKERMKVAERFVERCPATLVLKGAGTIVADREKIYVNKTGNPGMATAGTGDVLTGVIAALLGRGFGAFEAAQIGVHVHGLAGDLAKKEKGETGMIASDVLERLPDVFKSIAGHDGQSESGEEA
jgi:NAD(P)H-hydrate epimerase